MPGYDDTLGSAYPDGFVTLLTNDLSAVIASTYIGTEYADQVRDIAMNPDGTIVIAGQAGYGFPITTGGAFDRTYNGGTSDAFIAQFDKTGSGSGGGGGSPPADIAPVADAGNNQTVRQRQTVYLDGSGSSDPDGQIVRYRWTQLSGKRVSIRNADTSLAYFTAPRVRRGTTRTLEFELEVTDDLSTTAVDQVTISVTP